jgi:hypothetical protein
MVRVDDITSERQDELSKKKCYRMSGKEKKRRQYMIIFISNQRSTDDPFI